ncbi:MAG: electron transfer flavoprotein subunit alpha/FixB family protein [Myxococcales bacterium]|nr:electron transfer flavoprotein subunit alpha/FixB family protein [Myxococcales bacterium]USN50064.1 MAG: electron transfer flavoprotein subunit alpha/FixB family protein [Myxococcales bacterium]
MAIHLIFAEHDENGIKKSTLSSITAAQKIGGEIHGVVLGKNIAKQAQEFSHYCDKVHMCEHDGLAHRLAQSYSKVISDVAKNINATHVWASATVAGKDIFPRVAVRLNAAQASDIQEVVNESSFIRPVWAGDLLGEIELLSAVKVITVRVSEFPAAEKKGAEGQVVPFDVSLGNNSMRFVSFDAVKSERPELTDANVVVAGGRGLKSPENFKELIEPLADKLGAAIGASRAVCDAGWVPNDWQVGQTGKVVAPKLYFALGISGAIQHVAGMKGSKVIVAINKDPEAPIFQVADYGLVADVSKAIPELMAALS